MKNIASAQLILKKKNQRNNEMSNYDDDHESRVSDRTVHDQTGHCGRIIRTPGNDNAEYTAKRKQTTELRRTKRNGTK